MFWSVGSNGNNTSWSAEVWHVMPPIMGLCTDPWWLSAKYTQDPGWKQPWRSEWGWGGSLLCQGCDIAFCWNQFGSVSCVPSRFTRLWKWMFSMRVADFCMHLFIHLNLSYMLLGEWKAIISFFWSRSGRGTMISALQFCAKMVTTFLLIVSEKNEVTQPYFLWDLQTIPILMGDECLRIWSSEYKYPVECKHEYLTIPFSCDINKPLLACHVFIFRCQWSSARTVILVFI